MFFNSEKTFLQRTFMSVYIICINKLFCYKLSKGLMHKTCLYDVKKKLCNISTVHAGTNMLIPFRLCAENQYCLYLC